MSSGMEDFEFIVPVGAFVLTPDVLADMAAEARGDSDDR